ncbi:hypothetical protein R1flu_019967 [Riccia fluitans]|uniref:Uncharacterized protein n=1 Tax=Riccia fluitans TaxID=41844 RepID=A0ABD1ZK60_9MARC
MALHLAICTNNLQMVYLLLEWYETIDRPSSRLGDFCDNMWMTPSQYGVVGGYHKIVRRIPLGSLSGLCQCCRLGSHRTNNSTLSTTGYLGFHISRCEGEMENSCGWIDRTRFSDGEASRTFQVLGPMFVR